jgi:hypothetical protein
MNNYWTKDADSCLIVGVLMVPMIGSGPAPASAADFDRDGYADLAIGAPQEDVALEVDAGMVNVLFGSPDGLTSEDNQAFILEAYTADDEYPRALAAGNFDDDNYVDLAVGIPQEDIGLTADAGAVQILYGSADGIAVTGNQFRHQDICGVAGVAEQDDHFGSALATISLTRFRVYLPLVLNSN